MGGWVLLKNVHLTSNWLKKLDKRLHSARTAAHQDFRLFLTSDINPNLPATLVSCANKLIFEPPNGIKANLLRTLMMVRLHSYWTVANESRSMFLLTIRSLRSE